MNKPLILPKFKFTGPVPLHAVDPTGGPGRTIANFAMDAKNWTGVPVAAADAPTTPVAWTMDQAAIAKWDYDAAFFPTTDDYAASFGVFGPPVRWGKKNTVICKPKSVYLGVLLAATPASFLAPIAAKIADKKIIVNTFGSAVNDSAQNYPLHGVSLPANGGVFVEDHYTQSGSPVDTVNMAVTADPSQWTAGETLYFCWFDGISSTATDVPSAIESNILAADASRINACFPKFDKLGIHLITTFKQSANPGADAAWLPFYTSYVDSIMAAIAPSGPTKSALYQVPVGSTLTDILPTIWTNEVIPKIVSFFGL